MIAWIRRFFVMLLAVALLAAPCLTVFGPLGAANALARNAVHDQSGVGAAAHRHLHHRNAARSAGSGVLTIDHERTGEQFLVADSSDQEDACCHLCDGWRTSRNEFAQALHSSLASPHFGTADLYMAAASVPAVVRPPDGKQSPGVLSDRPDCRTAALYALTGRLRL